MNQQMFVPNAAAIQQMNQLQMEQMAIKSKGNGNFNLQ